MSGYGPHGSSLRDLARLRDTRRSRVSSYDRSGGNADWLPLRAGQSASLADINGAGSVNHVWITCAPEVPPSADSTDNDFLRKLVLRAYWDGSDHPSVNVPLGDFFGIGHARTKNFSSLPLQMSPEDGKAFNCWFPMPFADGARFEIVNECDEMEVRFYYYIDYEEFDSLEDGLGRFHSCWNHATPTSTLPDPAGHSNEEFLFGGKNTTGGDNYVILDATGRGHYVGCVLNITNTRHTSQWNWYGEGDDMIFVDGEPWPPRIHGTGTEDYFNTAWCPTQEYESLYHGLTLPGGPNWSGQISTYRFHIEDPITFTRSIRMTIEHGHDNHRSDALSSIAYWYSDRTDDVITLAPVDDRLPRIS
ncbi:hypothetical protein PACID_30190 [Acidipropionibacterium acidipropionici ATCC 4875]|uniref:DUF2961 domain-containing protein n=1 Tax=Acidipropionibacterium acidipropionici (strain ATCC 4875 / DSM 20272 / JCM 6432 / NBRC 12425 / NCIMB 8070 / 4) TaxID=1171373 RepID=K7RRX4_ACIA4|nr:glycoside hydrolase family 172 protein [Acidipropionibacterium acidipropionici]AFV90784.1 hypothetical protein PACID_30190 [Acidipropionibacterium acidipropionici ATCC 4875]ALN15064.1 hypothetical protein ASQ49_07055 [Acidipropionibacterium acidipropionici]APZ09185.1 hypothetical protein BWX38_07875 [Acidipropionibacterium acidipropionici]MDN6555183.1 DUF2961 domain-containing protein [Acidipropionibacterium acidipropionici]